eukprot:PhM_4_TR5243/c0_g1_i1/m.42300
MLDHRIHVRRSVREDIAHLHTPIMDSRFIYEKRFGEINLFSLIERSFIAVTALDEDDRVVGFASFTPTARGPHIPNDWASWMHRWCDDDAKAIGTYNTLWMTFFYAELDSQNAILSNILTTVLATLPAVDWFLLALDSGAPPFAPIKDLFSVIPTMPGLALADTGYPGTVMSVSREQIVPILNVRVGVVEDYDDLMPMLMAQDDDAAANGDVAPGVITPMSDNFFLDELLEQQDEFHAVLVAQDPSTLEIVGLMCLSAATEDQQHVTKKYLTDAYNNLKHILPPSRHGASPGHNVVKIDFLYLNPMYETRATAFLPHIYERFPFAEFCYIQLPHSTPEPALLHDFQYVPIRKFTPMGANGERLPLLPGLWLGCRYSTESLRVSLANDQHEEAFTRLLTTQGEVSREATEAMLSAMRTTSQAQTSETLTAIKPNVEASLVLEWRDQVAGTCVVRGVDVEELHALRTNYDVDAFVNFNPDAEADYGAVNIALGPEEAQRTYWKGAHKAVIIKHFYVRSVFRCRVRYLLREVMRVLGVSLVFFVASASTETFTPLLNELNLVMPRHVAEVHVDDTTRVTEEGLLCLHMQSMRGLSDEKTRINARIVVVGASTTGLSSLYHLLCIPYLCFTNLVLLSRDGLPDHPNEQDQCWTADSMDWVERQYLIFKVGKKMRVIEATLMDFDRADKYIMPDSGICEPYDYLICTTGCEYAIPKDIVQQKHGMLALNGNRSIKKIKEHIHESEMYDEQVSSVVVYGSSLDVYAVVNALIEVNLAAQRIVIVSPEKTSTPETSIFGDPLVDMKVDKLMESLGIKTYKHHVLEHPDFDDDNNLTNISIVAHSDAAGASAEQRRKNALDFPASLFVYLHDKDIDHHILSALNKRSIVFDGRVIIEHNYRTTDSAIYAAGPIAMFSRRFGKSNDFEQYSALEVGRKLSETLLGFIGIEEFHNVADDDDDDDDDDQQQLHNPLAAELGVKNDTNMSSDNVQRKPPKPLPQYTENISRRVKLPLGYQYLQFKTAGYGDIASKCTHLMSSNAKGSRYIRLSISPNKYIECVTYFGNEMDVEIFNLMSLVGKPESQFNLMYSYNMSRSDKGEATLDLLEFLRQQWARVLFYDRYTSLYKSISERIAQHPDVMKLKESMTDYVVRAGIDRISDKDRTQFMHRITHDHSDVRHDIELELIRFLHENKEFIPQQYFLPDVAEHLKLTRHQQ